MQDQRKCQQLGCRILVHVTPSLQGGNFVKYRLKTHRQVCRSPQKSVSMCGIIQPNVFDGQNLAVCALCGRPPGKKDIGAT